MNVEKPIDPAIVLVLENQMVIMSVMIDQNFGPRGYLQANINSTANAILASNNLLRREAEEAGRAWLRG